MEISLLGLIVLLLLSALVGVVAKAIVGYHYGGLLASIGLGFLGGILGIWLARALDLPTLFAITVGGMTIPIVWALVGTILLVALVALMMRTRVYDTTVPRRRYLW